MIFKGFPMADRKEEKVAGGMQVAGSPDEVGATVMGSGRHKAAIEDALKKMMSGHLKVEPRPEDKVNVPADRFRQALAEIAPEPGIADLYATNFPGSQALTTLLDDLTKFRSGIEAGKGPREPYASISQWLYTRRGKKAEEPE